MQAVFPLSASNSGTEEWSLPYVQILLKRFRSSVGMKMLSFISWVWNRNFCFERKALHARFLYEPWRFSRYLTLCASTVKQWEDSVSVYCFSASNTCVSHRKALRRCFLTKGINTHIKQETKGIVCDLDSFCRHGV